ncbi:MAG: hypothetical protein ACYT04_24090, partial [Nostoc sp.]
CTHAFASSNEKYFSRIVWLCSRKATFDELHNWFSKVSICFSASGEGIACPFSQRLMVVI